MRGTKPDLNEEKKLWKKGYDFVIGIDEVGRGAFAGPVTVGAVVFNRECPCLGILPGEINDSKLLKPQKREKLDREIKICAQFYSISEISVSVINEIGIGRATSMAFRKVIANTLDKIKSICVRDNPCTGIIPVKQTKYFVLVDGFHIRYIRGIGLKNQKAIIKGDQKSISIAAASIIAKVYRDNLMINLSKKYPQYNFVQNKGYGTKEHQQAIKNHGLSKIHRKSFNLSKFTSCR